MADQRLPVLFVSHGAPTLPLDPTPAREFLKSAGKTLQRPQRILAVSAHWETEVPQVSAAAQPETIHDFHGFPPELYRLRYPAPGAPDVADRVRQLMEDAGLPFGIDPARGLDHGAWTPLMLLFPEADIPVTQLSIQSARGPQYHEQLGRALAPLRDEGVMVMCSGSVTHNLGEFRRHTDSAAPPAWVSEFNEWLASRLESGRADELLAYRELAPHAARNHPTDEHLLPLFVALGAAEGAPARRLHSSYTYGVIGMDAYLFS